MVFLDLDCLCVFLAPALGGEGDLARNLPGGRLDRSGQMGWRMGWRMRRLDRVGRSGRMGWRMRGLELRKN